MKLLLQREFLLRTTIST